MADDRTEREWIVEPPRPGQVSLHMAFGDGVDLNDEQEAALAALIRALEGADDEVTAFAANCPRDVRCGNLECLTYGSCAAFVKSAGWSLMGTFVTQPRPT